MRGREGWRLGQRTAHMMLEAMTALLSFPRMTSQRLSRSRMTVTRNLFSCSSIMLPEIEPMAQQRVLKVFHDHSLPLSCTDTRKQAVSKAVTVGPAGVQRFSACFNRVIWIAGVFISKLEIVAKPTRLNATEASGQENRSL